MGKNNRYTYSKLSYITQKASVILFRWLAYINDMQCLVIMGFLLAMLSCVGKSHLQELDNSTAFIFTCTQQLSFMTAWQACVYGQLHTHLQVAPLITKAVDKCCSQYLHDSIIHMLVSDLTGLSSTLPAEQTSTHVRSRSCPGTAQLSPRWSWQVPPPSSPAPSSCPILCDCVL